MQRMTIDNVYHDEVTVLVTSDPRFIIEIKVRGEMYEAWMVNNVTDKASMMFAIGFDLVDSEGLMKEIIEQMEPHKKMHMKWYMPEQYAKEYKE